VVQVGPLVGLHAGEEVPRDYDGARATDEALYAQLFHALLDEGVALAPGAYEVSFPGAAHSDEVLDEVVAAAERAAARVAAARHEAHRSPTG
jgi:glutamate-1-semialdehyde 2,1-aminomutase